jgi:RimJ/RimL family protein N-acetyltransferase
MSTAPIIETERLRLRPHVRSDYAACKELWQHPETIRFIGGVAQDDQAVWFRLLRYGGMWPMLGFGFWVFEDKANRAYLGEGGLLDAARGIEALEHMPEVGWAIAPAAAGKGIATEAMQAILRWVDANLHVTRTACIIDPGNAPSLRVAAKLGFEEVDRPACRGEPIVLLCREPQAANTPESP